MLLYKMSSFLLLARGRDRLETITLKMSFYSLNILLLARGRDRLETNLISSTSNEGHFSYSLGDAIDWKLHSIS